MLTNTSPVIPFDVQTAGDDELSALNHLQNQLQSELRPDDPPRDMEVRRNGWRNMPAGTELRCWAVWDSVQDSNSRAIIANAWTEASTLADNYHIVNFNILVLPVHRRCGIGRRLLAAIVDFTEASQRHVLITQTADRLPAGALWMQRIGATPSLESQNSQLALAELNADLLQVWMVQAADLAQTFEMGFWEGPYPQNDLDAIARLHEIHNTAPRLGTRNNVLVTPEYLRQNEQASRTRGDARWTCYVREKSTGNLVGFTEVSWNQRQPEVIEHGFTGVLPDYRNRGLGRWLKAAMLDKIRHERPFTQFIRTGNATSNAPMLKINRELGFRSDSPDMWWEIELEQVRRYLAG